MTLLADFGFQMLMPITYFDSPGIPWYPSWSHRCVVCCEVLVLQPVSHHFLALGYTFLISGRTFFLKLSSGKYDECLRSAEEGECS